MDYQTFRQFTEKRSFTKPKYTNGNVFENHNYDFLQIIKTGTQKHDQSQHHRPSLKTQLQSANIIRTQQLNP